MPSTEKPSRCIMVGIALKSSSTEGLPKRVGRPALGPLPQNPSLLLAGPGPARPSLTPHFYRRARAGPAPQIPHFYRRALGPPGPPKSLTFIDGARAVQIPHFCWPDPSLLSARPDPVTPAAVTPRPKNVPLEQPPPISPGLEPSLFGKPSSVSCFRKALRQGRWLVLEDIDRVPAEVLLAAVTEQLFNFCSRERERRVLVV